MAESGEGASLQSSTISLVKTIIGAGLLSMPLAYSTDGIVVGTIIILVAALTSGYGLFLQAYVSSYVPAGNATFFNICSISYPSLSVVFDTAIAIQCFGCAVSYLVLVGDITPTIITSVPYISPESYRTFWIIVSSVICVPLAYLKNLDSLKYTSFLGLLAIGYMSLLVVSHFLAGDVDPSFKGDISLVPPTTSGVFRTFSIIVFAFTGHQNMFSIINEARDKSLKGLTGLINIVILASSALFIIVGLAGYLTFGDKVDGNVVLSYPDGWTTALARLCIVFMVIFSFPLMIHPARISCNNIFYWLGSQVKGISRSETADEETQLLSEEGIDTASKAQFVPLSDTTFNSISIILLSSAYILAITIKSFALVLAIVGATGSTAISFILPGLFAYKLVGAQATSLSFSEALTKHSALVLVIWGVTVMVVCLYTSIKFA